MCSTFATIIMHNKILDFFLGTPSYNEDKDYEAYAAITAPLNMFFLACLLLHTFYLIIFSLQSIFTMVLFDSICVILYSTFVILLKHFKGSWLPCTLVTVFELFLHQICSIVFFGLGSGFQYLMIPLIFVTAFIRKDNKIFKYIKMTIITIASVIFIFLLIFFNDYNPPYILPDIVTFILLVINCSISFIVPAIYTSRIYYSVDSRRSELDASVTEKVNKIETMQSQIIISFAEIIEARDGSTGKHVKRTSEYVAALISELKRHGDYDDILDDRYMHDIMMSAPLHDIGKITIPDAILCKPGRLTQSEFAEIKNHTIKGKELIEKSMSDIEDEQFLKVAKSVALYHHECWDGSGYPYGIEGEQIPLCARIMTIADYFDALVAKRSYKAALPASVVFDDIKNLRGKKFDPIVADAFLRIRDQIEEIANSNAP